MEIIFVLIPLSLVLVGVALWGFFWAVRSGQFDDLDSAGLDILNHGIEQPELNKQPEPDKQPEINKQLEPKEEQSEVIDR